MARYIHNSDQWAPWFSGEGKPNEALPWSSRSEASSKPTLVRSLQKFGRGQYSATAQTIASYKGQAVLISLLRLPCQARFLTTSRGSSAGTCNWAWKLGCRKSTGCASCKCTTPARTSLLWTVRSRSHCLHKVCCCLSRPLSN